MWVSESAEWDRLGRRRRCCRKGGAAIGENVLDVTAQWQAHAENFIIWQTVYGDGIGSAFTAVGGKGGIAGHGEFGVPTFVGGGGCLVAAEIFERRDVREGARRVRPAQRRQC